MSRFAITQRDASPDGESHAARHGHGHGIRNTRYSRDAGDAGDTRHAAAERSALPPARPPPGRPDEEWVPDARNLRGDFTTRRGETPYEYEPLLEAPRDVTALAGRALKLNGDPLPGVTVRIRGQSARTDDSDRFLLERIDPGDQVLVINGTTANQAGKTYGIFHANVEIEAGRTNKLDYTIWMPILDAANRRQITSPTTREEVITSPRLPGLELHIPAGSTITGADGRLVTEIGLSALPLDRSPFPVPKAVGFGFAVYFTVQPGGAYVSGQGAYLVYPNYSDETPGERGGYLLATGTPEDIAAIESSYTGQYLVKAIDASPVRERQQEELILV